MMTVIHFVLIPWPSGPLLAVNHIHEAGLCIHLLLQFLGVIHVPRGSAAVLGCDSCAHLGVTHMGDLLQFLGVVHMLTWVWCGLCAQSISLAIYFHLLISLVV